MHCNRMYAQCAPGAEVSECIGQKVKSTHMGLYQMTGSAQALSSALSVGPVIVLD